MIEQDMEGYFTAGMHGRRPDKQQPLGTAESGFVAIFVSIIIMMVLTLVVIGFTHLVREEQRRSLDRQLTTQAFYAAESGINDAVSAIRSGLITNNSTSCETPASLGASNLDNSLNVNYSCVLINTKVSDIKKDNVPVIGREQAFIMPLETDSNGPLTRLDIQWDSVAAASLPGGSFNPAGPVLPTTGAWGSGTVGGLRIDITPTTGGMTRSDMVNRTMTFYILPQSNGGGFTGTTTPSKGQVLIADCNDPDPDTYRCNTIVNLNPAGEASYTIRVTSLYNPARLWIRALNNGGGSVVLRNAQAIIDSQGKSADVFRRIQERVPISSEYSNYESPPFVMQSGNSICKRILAYPGMTGSPDLECGVN